MIELTPRKLIATPEETELLKVFAQVTGGYKTRFGNLEDILCDGESIEGGEFLNGQTAFFRHFIMNRYMLNLFKNYSTKKSDENVRIFDVPTSIGCSTYGLVALALSYDFNNISVEGFDRSETFTRLARLEKYPIVIARRLTDSWHKLVFEDCSDDHAFIRVKKEVIDRVTILDSMKIQDFDMKGDYDAMLVNNLFQYLKEEDIKNIIDRMVEKEPSLIVYTKKGAESVSAPLSRGYISIEDLIEPGNDDIWSEDYDVKRTISQGYGFWINPNHFNL